MPAAILASLPSPHDNVWHLGPIPIRAYALCIIAGIIAAIWIGEKRWVARGGKPGTVSDIAVWAVVFGLVGGRLYHVISDWQLYFGAGRNPWHALRVWEGGLGIWGAISLGGVGAWIGCRRRGIKLPPYADAVAPGIAVAQAIGRWGNWFNQELFGKPTSLPWGLKIDPDRPNTVPGVSTYHPTFLYESLWDLGLAGALVLVDRRFKLGRGRVFALYVMGYTAGRVWIEMLRIDTANTIFGVRLNVWTSIVVFAGALIYFLRHPGPRETEVEPTGAGAPAEAGAEAGAGADSDSADDPDRTMVIRTGAGRDSAGRDSTDLDSTDPGSPDSADRDSADPGSPDSADRDSADPGSPDSADRDSAGRAGADRGRTDPDSGDRDSGDRDEAGAPAGQGSGQDDAKTSGGRAQDAGDSAEPAERSDVGRR